MTKRQAEALRQYDRVTGWGESGTVLAIEPENHYILIEWDKDGARSHLDTRDCQELSREKLDPKRGAVDGCGAGWGCECERCERARAKEVV